MARHSPTRERGQQPRQAAAAPGPNDAQTSLREWLSAPTVLLRCFRQAPGCNWQDPRTPWSSSERQRTTVRHPQNRVPPVERPGRTRFATSRFRTGFLSRDASVGAGRPLPHRERAAMTRRESAPGTGLRPPRRCRRRAGAGESGQLPLSPRDPIENRPGPPTSPAARRDERDCIRRSSRFVRRGLEWRHPQAAFPWRQAPAPGRRWDQHRRRLPATTGCSARRRLVGRRRHDHGDSPQAGEPSGAARQSGRRPPSQAASRPLGPRLPSSPVYQSRVLLSLAPSSPARSPSRSTPTTLRSPAAAFPPARRRRSSPRTDNADWRDTAAPPTRRDTPGPVRSGD